MSIRTGDKAVPFTLPAKPGGPVDIGEILGREPVVLLFFPLAFSPVCTDEMCMMRDGWSAWEGLGAQVFGVTVDSPFVTEKFREELGIPFPILSDFNREVANTYGALHEDLRGLKGVTKRACFVIDKTGVVIYDWVSDDPSQLPDLDQVASALR
jgi:peroxiredoxin